MPKTPGHNFEHRYQTTTETVHLRPWNPKKRVSGFQKQLCSICNQFVHGRAMRNHMDEHKRKGETR